MWQKSKTKKIHKTKKKHKILQNTKTIHVTKLRMWKNWECDKNLKFKNSKHKILQKTETKMRQNSKI